MKLLLILLSVFRVAFVGDPQVDSQTELDYARNSIYKELRERKDIDLVVILGDLVNDKPELLAPSKASLDSLGIPWVCAPGNHDKDVYRSEKGKAIAPRDTRSFSRIIHAADTSFVMKGVRFVVMDDVKTIGRGNYAGDLRDDQLHWLDSLAQASNPKTPLVLATHIPVWEFRESARDSLAAILSPFDRVFLTCGHTHTVYRMSVPMAGRNVEILDAGSTCGTWWRGVKDEFGIPYAIMNCGSPRGYFVADFKPHKKQWYTLSFKRVQRSRKEQLSAFYRDSTLVANVWGGAKEGSLEVLLNGKWQPLERTEMPAPDVMDLKRSYKDMTREYRRAHREEVIPILGHASPHVWTVKVQEQLAGRSLKFRYSDPSMSFRTKETVRE